MLEMVRQAKRISGDLLPLCRAFRDPVFHEWMRKAFEMDVPTVLYWESMPDLAAELPPLLARAQRHGWRTYEEFQALLTGGQSEMLTRLLRDVNSGGPGITRAAGFLELSVLDAAGNPPPPTGLERSPDDELRSYDQPPVSPAFRQWCAGLTADDFTFDRSQRRFVRKPSTPPPP